jgi:hypothetical protein
MESDTPQPPEDTDFEAHMQGADSMELVDREIISATILEVDITEVYSPERVAKVAK